MGEITKEIDQALKNTVHLLSTISGERIRDKFLKGIASAKSQKHFIEMILKYDLFNWIFNGLNVNTKILNNLGTYNYKDNIVILVRLLKNNSIETLKKRLNDLKYSSDEIKGITFF